MRSVQLAAICAFVVVAGAVPMIVHSETGAPAGKGTWTQKAPMITPRAEVSLAEVGGKIYVLGGGINGTSVPHNEEYEIATDHWRSRYPMPRGLDHMGVAVVNGKIITVGGFVASVHRDGQPAVFEYDPAFDVWRALAPMKAGRGSVGAAVVAAEGKIHVIGGRFTSPADRTDRHDIYDPATNTWSSGPPLPTARSGLASAYYKGLVIVLGGEFPQEKRTFVENEGYDAKANLWHTLTPMPQGRHAAGAASDGKTLYVGGGNFLPGGMGGGPTGELMAFTLP